MITAKLIAPCGMNCGICSGFLREKNPCPGCNGPDKGKPAYCVTCSIKHCARLKKSGTGYCFACGDLPCARLKQLDKRYRTKYKMSMLENLKYIKAEGIRKFVNNEKSRWSCPKCAAVINVHKGFCSECGGKA